MYNKNNDNNYYNSPWPKYYSHNEDNLPQNLNSELVNGKIIYKSLNGYCMYGLAPCTGHDIKINVKKKYKYLIFYKWII